MQLRYDACSLTLFLCVRASHFVFACNAGCHPEDSRHEGYTVHFLARLRRLRLHVRSQILNLMDRKHLAAGAESEAQGFLLSASASAGPSARLIIKTAR